VSPWTWLDAINGAFELGGGALMILNLRRLVRDRSTRGVDLRVSLFFTVWGLWNLVFYAYVSAPLSWVGGLAMTTLNTLWLSLAFCWRNR
jgi:uncharacterized membrane protein YfcA